MRRAKRLPDFKHLFVEVPNDDYPRCLTCGGYLGAYNDYRRCTCRKTIDDLDNDLYDMLAFDPSYL